MSLSCCQAALGRFFWGFGLDLGWLVGGLGFEHGQDDVGASAGYADDRGVDAPMIVKSMMVGRVGGFGASSGIG